MIKDILEGAAKPMTLREIRLLILGTGVMVDSPELSSTMLKLKASKKIKRAQVASKVPGRKSVWAYSWGTE